MKTNNKCRTCNFYKQIYMISRNHFLSYSSYYCTYRDEIAKRNNTCDGWQKRIPEYDISLQRLSEVEDDIKYLLKHLKD